MVVDGSTDHSGASACWKWRPRQPNLRVWVLPQNRGKGAAVLFGLREARALGFTHVLTMDSDGQHPSRAAFRAFMQASLASPSAMVLGRPGIRRQRPGLRVKGRKISNWWANLETLWAGIDDSLFGFRVYPIGPLIDVMRRQPWMRRFDFDVEAVVRLCWRGVQPINLPGPGALLRPEEGGVSHFQLLARQCASDLDAFPAVLWVHRAPAAACRPASPPALGRSISCRTGPHLYNAAT